MMSITGCVLLIRRGNGTVSRELLITRTLWVCKDTCARTSVPFSYASNAAYTTKKPWTLPAKKQSFNLTLFATPKPKNPVTKKNSADRKDTPITESSKLRNVLLKF